MATLCQHDAQFTHQQSEPAELHATEVLLQDREKRPFPPHGQQSVNGSYTDLPPAQPELDPAGQVFPRTTDVVSHPDNLRLSHTPTSAFDADTAPRGSTGTGSFAHIKESDSILYTSWFDFALNISNSSPLIDFIAAYGTHSTIICATTLESRREAAALLVLGGSDSPEDRLDFLASSGAWAYLETGLNVIDFWTSSLASPVEMALTESR
jgi:hypothetical protein